MIVLRKPWSGSSPATYPTYFPFIGAFPCRRAAKRRRRAAAAYHPRVRGIPLQGIYRAVTRVEAFCPLLIHLRALGGCAPSGHKGTPGEAPAVLGASPIETSPDGSARGPGGDSPLGRERADDVKPAAAAWVRGRCQPRPAAVVDLDANVSAGAAPDADGKGSARPAGVAVQDSVGRQLREAENHLVRGGTPRQLVPRVGARLADVFRPAAVGGRGGAQVQGGGGRGRQVEEGGGGWRGHRVLSRSSCRLLHRASGHLADTCLPGALNA